MKQDKESSEQRWVRHRIAVFAPSPTPLTWDLLERLFAAHGGFGRACRLAGFAASERVHETRVIARRKGSVFLNLDAAAHMFHPSATYRYEVPLLDATPDAVYAPPTRLPLRHRIGTPLTWMARASLDRQAKAYAAEFSARYVPGFLAYLNGERERDISDLGASQWCARWQSRETEVLHLFGSQVLLAALLAGVATNQLHAFLRKQFPDEDTLAMASTLGGAYMPDRLLEAEEALHALAHGEVHHAEWLDEYGHLALEPLELASPRWREDRDALLAHARSVGAEKSPQQQHMERRIQAKLYAKDVDSQLRPSKQVQLKQLLARQQTYRRVRANGFFYLFMGVELLRELALDAARRLDIGDEVFQLSREQLMSALHTGHAQ